jgi:hypothetical protein
MNCLILSSALNVLKLLSDTRISSASEASFPYADIQSDGWTRFYSSREDFKKQARDASNFMNAENKLFAEQVIKPDVT